VRTAKIKNIQLYTHINDLSTSTVDAVYELVASSKGNCDLKLIVLDDEMQGGVVELYTKKFKVEPTNEFINELKKIGGFKAKFSK
jgi:hypothetical protein